jgi:hypothetical protein
MRIGELAGRHRCLDRYGPLLSTRTAAAASATSSIQTSSASSSLCPWRGRTPWPEPPPGCGPSAPGATTSHHWSRLPDGRWLVHASAPVGAGSTMPAPAAGPRRTSVAATAAVARISPTASGARPTIRSDGRPPEDGWRSGRSSPCYPTTVRGASTRVRVSPPDDTNHSSARHGHMACGLEATGHFRLHQPPQARLRFG